MTTVSNYIDHLYSNDLEGYVQVLKLKNGQVVKMFNTDIEGIIDVVQEQEGKEDVYITPNSFYIPNRANNNIRHFRALYIDLDLNNNYGKTEAFYEVYIKAAQGLIPKPSMIIDSGRGLHLYWRIEHAPKQAAYTWQELEDYLYKQLKPLGADLKATDAARVLRLPNTINSRNSAMCEVLELNDFKYSMYDLRDKYLNYQKKGKPGTDKKVKKETKNIKHMFNSYSLHQARAYDMEIIARLRNYDIKGYRNSIMHCYTYWKGIYIREQDGLFNIVDSFNSKLVEPLKDNEIKAIVRSTEKAIEKFIDYEQGIRSGEDKRVSKGMRDKGGYWYTNKTLIDMLNITEQEQRHLKTIISTQEKYRRNNIRRREKRRNEEGLTSREQQKRDTINKITELRGQGFTVKEIAESVGLTIKGVEYHLYNLSNK